MDIATLVGIVTAFLLVIGAIAVKGGLSFFIDVPSFLIVAGGTLGATLINYPLSDVIGVISVVKKAFFSDVKQPGELVPKMVEFATIARKEGVLALENEEGKAEDPFLAKALRLVVDGTEPELIKQVLETEKSYLEERHRVGYGIFETMGTFAPAFGMIGTLIGLVMMLQMMDDPSAIGPSMSIALITTFYGAVLANIIFLPIAGKLKKRSDEEILYKEMIIAGLLSIQSGDIPRVVEQKLNTFLAPKRRVEGKEKRAA